jgi:hypothetical protein
MYKKLKMQSNNATSIWQLCLHILIQSDDRELCREVRQFLLSFVIECAV